MADNACCRNSGLSLRSRRKDIIISSYLTVISVSVLVLFGILFMLSSGAAVISSSLESSFAIVRNALGNVPMEASSFLCLLLGASKSTSIEVLGRCSSSLSSSSSSRSNPPVRRSSYAIDAILSSSGVVRDQVFPSNLYSCIASHSSS